MKLHEVIKEIALKTKDPNFIQGYKENKARKKKITQLRRQIEQILKNDKGAKDQRKRMFELDEEDYNE